jgi:hypothetical protein
MEDLHFSASFYPNGTEEANLHGGYFEQNIGSGGKMA